MLTLAEITAQFEEQASARADVFTAASLLLKLLDGSNWTLTYQIDDRTFVKIDGEIEVTEAQDRLLTRLAKERFETAGP